jgi:hypothetical protein
VNTERLAAYLAGELDADEAAALEAALVHDARLRSDLDAMQRADAALGSVPATELPAGFEGRLRTAVDDELARILHASPQGATGQAATRPRDELATRRGRWSRSWVPVLAGAAATVAVIAGVALGVGVLGGGDDEDAASDTAMTLESFDDADTGEEGAEPSMPGDGPTVIAEDRELDDELADDLLASEELRTVTGRELDASAGRSLATAWRGALDTFGPADTMAEERTEVEEPQADADEAATEELEAYQADAPVRLFADGPLDEAELAAANVCLDEVLEAGDDAIPAYLELATYAGDPAVVIGLVTFDPASEAFTRPEVWVLGRDDCQVLRFSQG